MWKSKIFKDKFLVSVVGYLTLALAGFWFLTKSWFPQGFVIAGHDSGLALDSKKFLESRLWAWDEHLNFGQDNALNFGSIILHFIDYIFSALAKSEFAGNQISVFFWIAIIFSSALTFSLSLKKSLGKTFVFIFPVLATFNFYIFQSMFMLERAKYGLFVATMVFLAIILRVIKKKMGVFQGVCLSLILFFIFNGGSLWGLPLYGGLLVIVSVLFIHTLVWSVFIKKMDQLKRLVAFLLLVSLGFILINSYTILPSFVKFTYGEASSLFNQETIAPNKAWLDYISQASSFINIFRLQGIPDWYDNKYEINLNHPYAAAYTTDKLLVLVSFFFPVLAFLSFLLAKTVTQKRLISFFGLVVLISMIFVAGTHPPLGFIYNFLYENIPGFAIFRTPFYKFGSAFFLGMIFLISFTLSILINSFSGKIISVIENNLNLIVWQRKQKLLSSKIIFNLAVSLLTIVVISSWFYYHKVLFSPQIFNWQKANTTKINIPNYTKDFKTWAESNNINGRILLLPPLDEGWRVDSYNWGYWSLSSFPSMFVFENTIANDVSLNQAERDWLWELYTSIEQGREERVLILSKKLGIDFFLVRRDISIENPLFNLKKPEIFEGMLDSFNSIGRIASFGEWTVFRVNIERPGKIYAASYLVEIPRDQFFLYRDLAESNNIFLSSGKKKEDIPNELIIREAKSYPCKSCLIEELETNTVLPRIRVLPNSPLYLLKKIRERTELLPAMDDEEKVSVYLGFTMRRAGEVKQMLDFREREKYLLDDLKVINEYLAIVNQLLFSGSFQRDNFEQAKRMIQVLHPIEANFRIEVDKARSGTFSESVVNGLTDVLWQINRIKKFYSFVFEDAERWAKEKIFDINIPDSNSQVLLGTTYLPFDNNGVRVFPKEAFLVKDDERVPLEITRRSEDMLEMTPQKSLVGETRLLIIFEELENRFNFLGYKTEDVPRGTVGCYYGSVKKFNKTIYYRIKVIAANANQVLKLFVKEDREENLPLTYFLKGQREIDIFPILIYKPFQFIYRPTTTLEYLSIYVCTESKELPEIKEIFVEEIFSPNVAVSRADNKSIAYNLPQVHYERINPVKYNVSFDGGETPFILVFNERYDPLWKIKGDDDTVQYKHFVIDGYSNGWKIESLNNTKLTVEYTPQKFFYSGIIISFTVLVIVVSGIIYFVKRKS